MIIGFLGAILILIAWIPETYRTIKSRNVEAIDIRFLLSYIIGASLLLYYSFQINDMLFVGLNFAVLMLTIFEFLIVLWKKKII